MSKVTAPLLSFGASGQVAKTQVYSTWKGTPYVRRYVIPSNPKTAGQSLTRNTFSWLNAVIRVMPALVLDGWNAYADVQRYTARNGWIARNLPDLREETDLANLVLSPGVKSGTPASAMDLTPGDGQITVDLTAPTLPSGWTIVEARAAAIRDQDPQTEELYTIVAGNDAMAPYSIVLAGLTNAELYRVGGWFKYQRPDGSYAFGEAIMDSETPAA